MEIILVISAIWMMPATVNVAKADEKDKRPDSELIQGKWKFQEIHRDGKTIEPHEVIVRITKDEMSIQRKGVPAIESKYHLDTTKPPPSRPGIHGPRSEQRGEATLLTEWRQARDLSHSRWSVVEAPDKIRGETG